MSDFPLRDPRQIVLQNSLESLLETGAVNGLEYGFVHLSGPGLNEAPRPGADYALLNATAYYPGGIAPPIFQQRFALFCPQSRGDVSVDQMKEETGLAFDAIMKGKLGSAAQNDFTHGPNSLRSKYFANKLGARYHSKFMELAMTSNAPLSLVTLNEAAQSESAEHVATLYFPAGGPAQACLNYLSTSIARLSARLN